MRRKIMAAFVCSIMAMSVMPVYAADDTQTTQVEQEITTQDTTQTTKEKTSTKKTKDTKKSSKKKDTKSKKTDQEKVVPMPTQVVSKTSSSAIQSRISAKEAKITKLEKKRSKISSQIQLETKKSEAVKAFYKKYTASSKAEVALYGQEITPAIKISKKDETMRDDLYELADLFGDKQLRNIAGKYVFGINHPDFIKKR